MLAPFKFTNLTKALVRGAPSTSKRVADILRSYGTDAHLWLPGVGVVNGITAGNFSDTAGTTEAVVDSTAGVGLVVDAGKTLGPELVTNGDFSNGTTGWSLGANWTVSGGVATSLGSGGTYLNTANIVIAGKTYLCSFEIKSQTQVGGGISIGINGAAGPVIATGPGVYSCYLTAPTNTYVYVTARGGGPLYWQGTIDNISVREIVGAIPATQGTTANKPILRQSGGRYSWQFDGTDLLTLGSVPWTGGDDICVVVGATTAELAANTRVAFGVSGETQRYGVIYLNNGYWRFRFVDDAAAAQELAAANQVPSGGTRVIAGRKVGNTRILKINGVQEATSSAAVGTTTVTSAAIGSMNTAGLSQYLGNIGPVIAIKGTVSDADLLTLEKWVGSLSGVSL